MSNSKEMYISMAKRLLGAAFSFLLTLFLLSILTFVIGRMMPIDPVTAILGDSVSQVAYDAMYHELGLDKPVLVQFGIYLNDLVHLDLGRALTTGKPITEDIARVFPATLELATVAIVIGTSFGVPMGVYSAMYRDTVLDICLRGFSLLAYSTPNFWLGLLGLSLFYAGLQWVGGPGRIDYLYELDMPQDGTGFLLIDTALAGNWAAFRNALSHIALPATILGFGAMAYIARMTRSFMIEQLSREYIIAAQVKGVSWHRTVWFHGVPNAAVQIITVVVLSYAFLLEGAVVTETVFAWPGFGRYMTNGLLVGDMNAVVGCTLLVGMIFLSLNMLSDALYQFIDKRIE